jgi:N-methylhydantoinase A/oxoprolinase/acetone carboxylase beta subunit
MRVGIDVGGTMTDLIAYDPVTGEIIVTLIVVSLLTPPPPKEHLREFYGS